MSRRTDCNASPPDFNISAVIPEASAALLDRSWRNAVSSSFRVNGGMSSRCASCSGRSPLALSLRLVSLYKSS
eukprot:3113960-Pyramimonas_sp.AAC.1